MAEVKDVNRQIAYDVIKHLYLDDIITLDEYINLASAVMVSDPVIVNSDEQDIQIYGKEV